MIKRIAGTMTGICILALLIGSAQAGWLGGTFKPDGEIPMPWRSRPLVSCSTGDWSESSTWGNWGMTVDDGTHAVFAAMWEGIGVYVDGVVVPPEGTSLHIEPDLGVASYADDEYSWETFMPRQSLDTRSDADHLITVLYSTVEDPVDPEEDIIQVRYDDPEGHSVAEKWAPVHQYWDIFTCANFNAGEAPVFPDETYFIAWDQYTIPFVHTDTDRDPDGIMYFGMSPTDYDVYGMIAQEPPGQLSIMHCSNTTYHGPDYDVDCYWIGQTFIAYGDSIVAVQFDCDLDGGGDWVNISIHEGDISGANPGPQVGPTARIMLRDDAWESCCWRTGDVPVTEGEMYHVVVRRDGWLPMRAICHTTGEDRYPLGQAYEHGLLGIWHVMDRDVAMTIVASGELSPIPISDVHITDITSTGAIVRWTTDIESQARVSYGIGTVDQKSKVDPYVDTEQAIVLTDLTPGTEYTFVPESHAAYRRYTQGTQGTFTTPAAPTPGVTVNPSLETGTTAGWQLWGDALLVADWTGVGYIEAADGRKYLTRYAYRTEFDGGAYQTIGSLPGNKYEARVQANLYWSGSDIGPTDTAVRIGLDPSAGTDPAGGSIVWSAWIYQPDDYTNEWLPGSVQATATGTTMTIFVEYRQPDGGYWHITAIDDLEVYPVVDMDLPVAWSMITPPCQAQGSMAVTDIITGVDPVNSLFRYDGASGYAMYPADFTVLEAGLGYWIRPDVAANMGYVGEWFWPGCQPFEGTMYLGWSLIGTSEPGDVPLASCQVSDGATTLSFDDAVTAGWLEDTLYAYDGGYIAVRTSGGDDDSLRGGRAHWVLTNQAGLSLLIPDPYGRYFIPY